MPNNFSISDLGRRSTTVTVNGLTGTFIAFPGKPTERYGVNFCNPGAAAGTGHRVAVKLVRSSTDVMTSFTDCDYVLQLDQTLPIEAPKCIGLLAMNDSGDATTSAISAVEIL